MLYFRYNSAIKIDPNNDSAYNNKGFTLKKLGYLGEALTW